MNCTTFFQCKRAIINTERYCGTLNKLRRAIQKKRREMLTSGVFLRYDNARSHVAASTTTLLNRIGCDVLTHPPYRPDLAPSDYYLYTKLKESLVGKRSQSDNNTQTAVTNYCKEQAESF
uniref:Tc1-like transposase DDE domain-containing protein n=1 Tax=Graphocephala atropunctata TaxID=36148 RepID=A0A1B6KUH8_9HEMI